jgi:hypothetical protein
MGYFLLPRIQMTSKLLPKQHKPVSLCSKDAVFFSSAGTRFLNIIETNLLASKR